MKNEYLIETMRLAEGKIWLLDYHYSRLRNSALMLGFAWDETKFQTIINDILNQSQLKATYQKIRLCFFPDGRYSWELSDYNTPISPILCLSIIDASAEPMQLHKTSQRRRYELAAKQAKHAKATEAIFIWPNQRCREGSISNVFLPSSQGLRTPALSEHILPGTFRAWLLAKKEAFEDEITIEELRTNDFFLGNSVMGLVKAKILC